MDHNIEFIFPPKIPNGADFVKELKGLDHVLDKVFQEFVSHKESVYDIDRGRYPLDGLEDAGILYRVEMIYEGDKRKYIINLHLVYESNTIDPIPHGSGMASSEDLRTQNPEIWMHFR